MATKCISVMQEANLDQAKRRYLKAKAAYYNSEPIMTDAEFDKLEDQIRKLHPTWSKLKQTGTKVANKKIEVPLEEYMPSLNKMYPEAVDKFFRRPSSRAVESWVLTDKLDGTSLQLVYVNNEPVSLVTRGDGVNGGNISFFIPHLVKHGSIPYRIPTKKRTVFRIEGLMRKKVFDKKWSSKFENIRNTVNGLFNRMDFHPALKDVDLVVLGVYGRKIVDGLRWAEEVGFDTVPYDVVRRSWCSVKSLTKDLEARRAASGYEMDGRVLCPADWMMEYASADKPKATIAFKINDDANAAEVKVTEVIWQKTRLKRWQPKVRIEPTRMDGVTVTNATAHNPAWMKERGIGPGAIVKVLRSGGVIPKIVGVVKPVKFKEPPGPYVVDGRLFKMLEHDKSTEVRALNHFLVTMGVELIAEKSVAKMYDAGIKTVEDYLEIAHVGRTRPAAASAYFQKAGFGQIDSSKKAKELIRVFSRKVSLKSLMVASNMFERGMGEKRLAQIEAAGISMGELTKKSFPLYNRLIEVKGFKNKSIEAIRSGIDSFNHWLHPLKDYLEIDGSLPKEEKVNMEGKLYGMNVTWTTYRNREQEARVKALGGSVVSFGAKTDVLLYDPNGKASTKVEKAGSKAMTWQQFCKRYGV